MNPKLVKCILDIQTSDEVVYEEKQEVKNSYFQNLFNSSRLAKASIPIENNYYN